MVKSALNTLLHANQGRLYDMEPNNSNNNNGKYTKDEKKEKHRKTNESQCEISESDMMRI